MNNLFLVGDRVNSQLFIDNYIKENKFETYEVRLFEEKIKIEQARQIKRTLSFRQTGKLLFVFFEEITLEAQNALLKSIEEHQENVFFIFCAEKEMMLLETIRSRCLVKKLFFETQIDASLQKLTETLFEKSTWREIDLLLEYLHDKPVELLIPVVRRLLLDNIEDRQKTRGYYNFCKKITRLLPLVEINNVNKKVIIENAFFN